MNNGKITEEAWAIIFEAADKGYIDIAIKRIQSITGVSYNDARDILDYMLHDRHGAKSSNAEEKRASGEKLRDYVNEARRNPHQSVTCMTCRVQYPKRLSYCPGCGAKQNPNNTIKMTNINSSGIRDGLTPCGMCAKSISPRAESCPHCGNPTGVHVCPNCNGINTKVISGTSKATSIFLWGAFAANKVVSKFECKDCGHRF